LEARRTWPGYAKNALNSITRANVLFLLTAKTNANFLAGLGIHMSIIEYNLHASLLINNSTLCSLLLRNGC
jgi:hypothetical protein